MSQATPSRTKPLGWESSENQTVIKKRPLRFGGVLLESVGGGRMVGRQDLADGPLRQSPVNAPQDLANVPALSVRRVRVDRLDAIGAPPGQAIAAELLLDQLRPAAGRQLRP